MQVEDSNDILATFFHAAKNDLRLSATHVSLYFVLYRYWCINNNQNPISITRRGVMKLAKIKSIATYTKCIYQLNNFGYITYVPSYNPAKGSEVYLNSDYSLKCLVVKGFS